MSLFSCYIQEELFVEGDDEKENDSKIKTKTQPPRALLLEKFFLFFFLTDICLKTDSSTDTDAVIGLHKASFSYVWISS